MEKKLLKIEGIGKYIIIHNTKHLNLFNINSSTGNSLKINLNE